MWISLPLFLCTALFHFKHEVQRLEDEIQRIKFEIAETQESIDVIHAEWGHLTDPQRLTQLNARFFKLVPTEPKQIITLAELPEKKSDIKPEILLENASSSKTIKVAQKS
jgi:hypothetical protein